MAPFYFLITNGQYTGFISDEQPRQARYTQIAYPQTRAMHLAFSLLSCTRCLLIALPITTREPLMIEPLKAIVIRSYAPPLREDPTHFEITKVVTRSLMVHGKQTHRTSGNLNTFACCKAPPLTSYHSKVYSTKAISQVMNTE